MPRNVKRMAAASLRRVVARQLVEARAGFRADVEQTLGALRDVAVHLEPAIGEISPAEAFRGWCREMSKYLTAAADDTATARK